MKITQALESYLKASFVRSESSNRERKFYVSDMGKCMRQRWLKRHGILSEMELLGQWTVTLGNIVHDWGYKALEAQGLLLESEMALSTDHLSGRFDGLIKNGKLKSIFDFKSVGGYKMKMFKDGGDNDSIGQLLTYVYILQEERKDISDTALIVALNREPNQKRYPFAFHQREYHLVKNRREQIKAEIDVLLDYWINNKIPRCTCPAWMKDYNSYLPLCSGTDNKIRECLKYIEDGKTIISSKKAVYLVDGNKRKELK